MRRESACIWEAGWGAWAVLLAALMLTGCGGSRSRKVVDTAAFANRANAACASANAQVEAIKRPADLESIVKASAEVIGIAKRLSAKLTALVPPSPKRREYSNMLGALKRQITKASDERQALAAGDLRRGSASGTEVSSLSREFNSIAAALGLSACATNAQPMGLG